MWAEMEMLRWMYLTKMDRIKNERVSVKIPKCSRNPREKNAVVCEEMKHT